MASDWEYQKIEGVAEKVGMGPFGSSIKVSTFVSEGVPVISGQHLHESRLQDGEYNFITPEHAERLKNSNVFRGDVIFTHAGNIGQVAYIPNTSRYECYVISQRQFYMRCDKTKVIPAFVTYYFKTAEGQHNLLANSSPSGVPSLAQPVTYLRSLEIPVPPLKEQRALACILGALDDKIELNRRMNETLEGIARAIFKSWFVDFDPVRAKADGQQPPGLASYIADLFPDALETNELESIPRGWEVKTLAAICHKPQYGYTASAKDDEVGPKFLRITDINKTPWIDWTTVPYCQIEESDYQKYQLHVGDMLIARMADPGHGVVIEEQIEAVFASYLIRFRPFDSSLDRYLQYWLRSHSYWDLVRARQTGTTRPTLNAQVIGNFELLVPPPDIAQAFGKAIDSLRGRTVANVQQSNALAALRDTLLPKLISGELRVPDAEQLLDC